MKVLAKLPVEALLYEPRGLLWVTGELLNGSYNGFRCFGPFLLVHIAFHDKWIVNGAQEIVLVVTHL
eukprot:XP_001706035.1 Hypothetical protein GL50803_31203 [Giardia lamblia ATCC 50803]